MLRQERTSSFIIIEKFCLKKTKTKQNKTKQKQYNKRYDYATIIPLYIPDPGLNQLELIALSITCHRQLSCHNRFNVSFGVSRVPDVLTRVNWTIGTPAKT